MDNSANMLQLCRLCLVKDEVNIPIFEEQGDIRQIFQKISSCLPVKVSQDDKLPKKICDGCSYKLDMCYEFWNTSANTEKQLLSWLSNLDVSEKLNDVQTPAGPQPAKPTDTDTIVKQEEIDPSDVQKEEEDDEEEKGYMFQQNLEENNAGPSAAAAVAETNEDEPPPKRQRRTAAVKAAIAIDNDSDDDDDSGEPITKMEDESEDSDGDDNEPSYADVPSTSADDQPGPSGVGKDGADAPYWIQIPKAPKRLQNAQDVKKSAHSVAITSLDLLPKPSKKAYHRAYNLFLEWKADQNSESFSENVLMAYFSYLAKKFKSTTLWTQYSMLRTTLSIHNNIDIAQYSKLRAFLKRQSGGYMPKKSKIFTSDDIDKFIKEAPEEIYLATKVALIMGIMGACRRHELYQMKVNDFTDLGTATLVTIPDTKTKIIRNFIITGRYYEIYKRYVNLRPPNVNDIWFFINYQKGRCGVQRIGLNKLGAMGKDIAKYLKLPNPELYTGHCFRRSAATILVDSSGDITTLKRHGVQWGISAKTWP